MDGIVLIDKPSGITSAEVVRRMSEIARRAADRGLSLVLENEKGIYGDTAARVLDVLEAVDSPSLSHAFDPANYVAGQHRPHQPAQLPG